jgi:hypothetical protein
MDLVLPRDSCSIEQVVLLLVWCFNKGMRGFTLRFDTTDKSSQNAIEEIESPLADSQIRQLSPCHFIEPTHTEDIPLYALRRENMAYVGHLLWEVLLNHDSSTPCLLKSFVLYGDADRGALIVAPNSSCYLQNFPTSEEQEILAYGVLVERVEE